MKILLLTSLFFATTSARAEEPFAGIFFSSAPLPGLPQEALDFKSLNLKAERSDLQVLHGDIPRIRVRYFSPAYFLSEASVSKYLSALNLLRKGSTMSFIPWAEDLPVPMIEAVVFRPNQSIRKHGVLLVWPSRAAYRDSAGDWWFSVWSREDNDRLMGR